MKLSAEEINELGRVRTPTRTLPLEVLDSLRLEVLKLREENAELRKNGSGLFLATQKNSDSIAVLSREVVSLKRQLKRIEAEPRIPEVTDEMVSAAFWTLRGFDREAGDERRTLTQIYRAMRAARKAHASPTEESGS